MTEAVLLPFIFLGSFVPLVISIIICVIFSRKANETTDTEFMPIWILWILLNIPGLIIIFVYWNKVTKNKTSGGSTMSAKPERQSSTNSDDKSQKVK